jgi:hypothetical protein
MECYHHPYGTGGNAITIGVLRLGNIATTDLTNFALTG